MMQHFAVLKHECTSLDLFREEIEKVEKLGQQEFMKITIPTDAIEVNQQRQAIEEVNEAANEVDKEA